MISQHMSFQRIDTEQFICVLETEWKDPTKEREMAVNQLFCNINIQIDIKSIQREPKDEKVEKTASLFA